MWSLFSPEPNNKKLVAVFDIGSGSIGGALVELNKETEEERPKIISSVRFEIRNEGDPSVNPKAFTKEMLSALKKTTEHLFDLKKGAPDKIFCMLASPWYYPEIRTITESRLKKVRLNDKTIRELSEKELVTIKREYNERFNSEEQKREVIEQFSSSFLLDGKFYLNPFGKKARNITMDLVVSTSPKKLLDKIKKIIEKSFPLREIKFMSFSSASFLAIRDNFIVNNDTYFLIDISGQTTDITAIEKGFIKSFKSFSFGRKNIFRYLANKFKFDYRDAKNLFSLYDNDNLSIAMEKKVAPEVSLLKKIWLKKFKNKIEEIKSEGIKTSKTFFVTADDDVKKWFTQSILESEIDNTLIDENKGVNIISLDGSEFLHSYYPKKCRFDSFLAIATIALNKEKIKTYGKN